MPIEGELVLLREQRAEDIPMLVALRNDLTTQSWNKALPTDYTEPMLRDRFSQRKFSFDRSDGAFIIERTRDSRPIGHISYSNVMPRHGASVGMGLERVAWGTGVAEEALELLLKFLFLDLGLRVAHMWTNAANERAVGLAQRVGFRVSMRARESCYKGGRLVDTLMMDILREEFLGSRGIHDELPPIPDSTPAGGSS